MFRPLYLYFRGRLDTERARKMKGSTSYASKDRFVMPGNSKWGSRSGGKWGGLGSGSGHQDSVTLQGSDKGVNVEEAVDLELGPKITDENYGTKTEAWAA